MDIDLDDLEQRAREQLDPMAYDYFAGGAERESTLRDNVHAWERWRLRPHVLRDVRSVRVSTTVLGAGVSSPVLVAPTAYHRLAHDEGEAATARGTATAGGLLVVSTLATTSLEEVAAAAPLSPRWFQLYAFEDRGYVRELLARAREAGYRAIVLTVDAPVWGHRPRDVANRFRLPDGLTMANVSRQLPDVDGNALASLFTGADRGLTVEDLGWLAEEAGLPVVVKGIHRGDDAVACVDAGAAAIVVSNHGGRQLDGAIASADALPDVVDAVAGRAEVYVDGGIRRGVDVVRALGLGARAVLIGRPVLWALTTGGADGVRALLEAFRDDVARVLSLCGVADATQVPADLVVRTGPFRPSGR